MNLRKSKIPFPSLSQSFLPRQVAKICRLFASAVLCAAVALPTVAWAEFIVPDPGWHSYIDTENGRVKDSDFKVKLSTALGGMGVGANYDDLVVVMGQCYGGGMLAPLQGFLTSALTSASRWNERSWSTDAKFELGGREGAYVKEWATAVDTPAKRNMLAAYTEANKNDPAGPVTKTYFDKYGEKYLEHPQYKSSSPLGDAIKLRDSTPAVAVLFGGSENSWANFNSLTHIHDVLINRYGYAANDLYVMYPGATKPDGTAFGNEYAWINHRAKGADLDNAFTWLKDKAKPDAKPDVLYWNSQQHGSTAKDARAAAPPGARDIAFDLTSEFLNDYVDRTPGGTASRWLHLAYSSLSAGDELFLDDVSLGFLPAGDQSLDLLLDPSLVSLSMGSNHLRIAGSDTFDKFSAIDLGLEGEQTTPVPEPAAFTLVMAGGLILLMGRWIGKCRRQRMRALILIPKTAR